MAKETLLLTPDRNLTVNQVLEVAEERVDVALSEQALKNIVAGHDVVMQAALNNRAVYGLTVGVGWNKDQPVFKEIAGKRILSPELIELSKEFNISSLRAHASSVGKPLPIETVRAAMLIRLNTFLNGEAGVSPEVASYYLHFLNLGITPLIPSVGTVGEADITLSAHIGLAMIGEWYVFYKGEKRLAKEVLAEVGLAPLSPVGKDFLSILSNNALMAAEAIFALLAGEEIYQHELLIFALALEGLNGNIAPFSHSATESRPYLSSLEIANDLRETLKGSDLWSIDASRALQDPLSYRSMVYSLGLLREALYRLELSLLVQINHSDDNPLVLIDGLLPGDDSAQMAQYLVAGAGSGAIVPTSNFNFLPVTIAVSDLNLTLAKLAEVITQQIIRLENSELTQLPRFLAAQENHGHAFGAIQKPFTALNQQIKQLALPQWVYGVTLAGNIEDTSSMSGLTLLNNRQIVEAFYPIMAYQLLHAAQAVELREGFTLSEATQALHTAYRQEVPFLTTDTITSDLIEKSQYFLQQKDK